MAKNLFKNITDSEILKIGREVNYINTYSLTNSFLSDYYVSDDNIITTFLLAIMKIINDASLISLKDSKLYLNQIKQSLNDLLKLNDLNEELLKKYFPEIPEKIINKMYAAINLLSNLNDEEFDKQINASIKEIMLCFAERNLTNSKKAIPAIDLAEFVKAKLYRLKGYKELSFKELELVMFIIQKEFLKIGYMAFNDPILITDEGLVIKNVSKKYARFKETTIPTFHEDIKSYINIPVYFFNYLNNLLIKISHMNEYELIKEAAYEKYVYSEKPNNVLTIKRILKDIDQDKK